MPREGGAELESEVKEHLGKPTIVFVKHRVPLGGLMTPSGGVVYSRVQHDVIPRCGYRYNMMNSMTGRRQAVEGQVEGG
ncbi:hypothetical protein EYF80_061702 [Liparis tanakae]|uniref:Uncharacterized protein n=1 Tax=Liparis tanakae TaxID=230148 RepID=A0A4Z2EHU5_9TELE|nr:hypothetical protein EYF80_061702 [Liparis tanakae]